MDDEKKDKKLKPKPNEPSGIDWFIIQVDRVWNRRLGIAAFAISTTLLSAILTLLEPNQYTAEATLLPDVERNKVLGLAGMADLSSLGGFGVGEAPVSRLYPMIIKSARILRGVIYSRYKADSRPDSVNLVQLWGLEDRPESQGLEIALRQLRDRMEVYYDVRLSTLTLKVVMEEARLAADVANRINAGLDLYTRTKRKTSVTAQREFIEKRLAELEGALAASEETLRVFKEKNRRVLDSPLLLLEQARLERLVTINSTVFIELKKQVEIAKIEEIKNIPIINILDSARVPQYKSSPKRTAIVVQTLIGSLILGIGGAVALGHPMAARLTDLVRVFFRKGTTKTLASNEEVN